MSRATDPTAEDLAAQRRAILGHSNEGYEGYLIAWSSGYLANLVRDAAELFDARRYDELARLLRRGRAHVEAVNEACTPAHRRGIS